MIVACKEDCVAERMRLIRSGVGQSECIIHLQHLGGWWGGAATSNEAMEMQDRADRAHRHTPQQHACRVALWQQGRLLGRVVWAAGSVQRCGGSGGGRAEGTGCRSGCDCDDNKQQ